MAVEAGRQRWTSEFSKVPPVFHLTNVRILQCLPLVPSVEKPETIEIQLISKFDEGPARILFEIHSSRPNAQESWNLCCTGTIEAPPDMRSATECTAWDISNDLILLQNVKSVEPHLIRGFENLKMSSGKVAGRVKSLSPSQYPVDPATLAPLLSLGPLSLLDQRLPVKYRIDAIETLQLCTDVTGPGKSTFAINTKAYQAGEARSRIEVRYDDKPILTLEIRYIATGLLSPKPLTSSLFFRSVCLPDITKQIEHTYMSIQRLFQLLTHKWPMSDIVIGDVSLEIQELILRTLIGGKSMESHNFRSAMVCGKSGQCMNDDRIRLVEELSSDLEAHIIFTKPTTPAQYLIRRLQPHGLACIIGSKDELEQAYWDSFDYLGQVTSLNSTISTLWRRKASISHSSVRRRFIFSAENSLFEGDVHINLRPSDIERFIDRSPDEPFDAILVDDTRESIILQWPGKTLIPWLRHLMEHARSILWITIDTSSGPFVNVAGTLLRTLQAEQPSLKVCWLVLDRSQFSEETFAQKVNDTFESMLQGDNEIKLEVIGNETEITRYIPDNDLSRATGVSLPRQIWDPIGNRDYALTIAAPNETAVLSYDLDVSADTRCAYFDASKDAISEQNSDYIQMDQGSVRVAVMASLIGSDDLAAYEGHDCIRENGATDRSDSSRALRTFFTGKVLASTTSSFSHGSSVVGWTEGAHANIVEVLESNLYPTSSENYSQNLAEFTSLATAMAIMDGHIRARRDDHLELINIPDMLYEAITATCQHLQAALPECQNLHSPIFEISMSSTQQPLVNGTPTNITNYLSTHSEAFSDIWTSHKPFTSAPRVFPFASHKEAFATATANSFPTILTHDNINALKPHTPIYRPSPLFPRPSTGTYIIIGGLGGLGQYICHYLLSQGLQSLHIISRTGLSSPAARKFQQSLLSAFPSASINILTADACSHEEMSKALVSIRAAGISIKGVINLAMVLGDAPIAEMSARQWDSVLWTKVRSSWLLHQLTLGDDLEVFLLFSSIASVLGNRGQGSYNVGNAYLNALATWRRGQGRVGERRRWVGERRRRVGVSVCLGAVVDRGVLAQLHYGSSSSVSSSAAE